MIKIPRSALAIKSQLDEVQELYDAHDFKEPMRPSTMLTKASLDRHKENLLDELDFAKIVQNAEQISQLGDQFYIKGDYKNSYLKYSESLDLINRNFGINHYCNEKFMYKIGRIYIKDGLYDKGLEIFQNCLYLLISNQIPDKILLVTRKYLLASAFYYLYNWKEAKENLDFIFDFYNNNKNKNIDKTILLDCKNIIANYFAKNSDYNKSISILQPIITELLENNFQFFDRLILYLSNLSYCFAQIFKINDAYSYIDKAIKLAKDNFYPNDHPIYVNIFQVLAFINYTESKYEIAKKYYNYALQIAIKKIPKHPQIQTILFNLESIIQHK